MKPGGVAALCPALDVLVDEAGVAELFEVGADFLVSDAVVEPLVDLSADGVGEAGDFAGQTAGGFYRRGERRGVAIYAGRFDLGIAGKFGCIVPPHPGPLPQGGEGVDRSRV